MPVCVKHLKRDEAGKRNTYAGSFSCEEITQPQGHSTSGSHERYKSAERLEWEREWDGNRKNAGVDFV